MKRDNYINFKYQQKSVDKEKESSDRSERRKFKQNFTNHFPQYKDLFEMMTLDELRGLQFDFLYTNDYSISKYLDSYPDLKSRYRTKQLQTLIF